MNYSYLITDGTITTATEFLNMCIQEFGMFTHEKQSKDYTSDINQIYDDQIKYHANALQNAVKKLEEQMCKDDDQVREEYKKFYETQSKQTMDNLAYYHQAESSISDIKSKIKTWDCSPEFKEIKEFALKQLDGVKTNVEFYEKKLADLGDYEQGFEKYKQKKIEDLRWTVNYHKEELEAAHQRKTGTLDFYNKFKTELKKLDDHDLR